MFGLGEAGGLISKDLVTRGFEVRGYDPAEIDVSGDVQRVNSPAEAVADCDLVLSLTAAADATGALEQAIDHIPSHAVYADCSTASPGLKRRLAEISAGRFGFADVAIMAPVPGKSWKYQ